ncbi:tRNA-dihydrouridine(47) synthase [NAD(P)(+)] [Polychaeton citri CBS 116435]|uniref:tRNA-dihydrouridine(47) synthase [NAD(P)(+)] n=1 Tax=Polychaeton citri CBS 116435 TaxID=1314669 RepID=A0A9P4UN81_9PEZI|nr:tRNA-dihydrouridine(47) synthase [NAD(P)(+)] [Polychaeton citri CBS 116435]
MTKAIMSAELNPIDQSDLLEPAGAPADVQDLHPQKAILPGDSATTTAEKIERHGNTNGHALDEAGPEENAAKRRKLSHQEEPSVDDRDRVRGVAPIKKEFLIDPETLKEKAQKQGQDHDDDAAEAQPSGGRGGKKNKGGQNHNRTFGSSRDAIPLCSTRRNADEFSPGQCQFEDKCKYEHDLRRYLKDGRREDLKTFDDGRCPIFQARNKCNLGWKCRFVGSHSKEVEREDGRKELVLLGKDSQVTGPNSAAEETEQDEAIGTTNIVTNKQRIDLKKRIIKTPKSEQYLKYLGELPDWAGSKGKPAKRDSGQTNGSRAEGESTKPDGEAQDHRAGFVDGPLLPSEKRRIYYGPETPVLAPLTTQGNLPYRRLCVGLGAQVTWSEMAMGLPLLQGEKTEWALVKAHESELVSPTYRPQSVVQGYDNEKDFRFGVQIAANKPWLACKTTEALTALCPHLRAIDLNCGCPIDLVYRQGAGSALLDAQAKLEKTLRGMNVVSGDVPITVKIRMGCADKKPTAEKLCQRLLVGGEEAQISGEGPAGVAAITLHGRSRQQRYTKAANWEYIADCSNLIDKLKRDRIDVTDTIREPDARDLSSSVRSDGLPYFCGNGDILSHEDYNTHISESGVDSIMIGRGALIKPWLFEEIATGQYLDKSASERMTYVEQFCRYGLEHWGSDEIGVGITRRFLLEWLSFACRYVPIGLLEVLPPKFGDRAPAFRGRSDLETLLCSANYKDWIKISEMFLGPAHKDFRFEPKHKSNSYEIEAEG